MSCGVDHRHGLVLVLLWLWCRSVAAALLQPLGLGNSICHRCGPKKQTNKHLETNDNEDMMIHNLWDTAKAVLRGKFTAIQSHLRKQEKFPSKQPNFTPKATRERRTNKTQR